MRWRRHFQHTLSNRRAPAICLRALREIRPLDPEEPFYHAVLIRDESPSLSRSDSDRTFWYTDVPDLRAAWCGNRLKRVANLADWRVHDPTLPRSPRRCAEALLTLAQELGLRLPPRPAQLAWKLFRRYLERPIPPAPRDVSRLALERNPGLFLFAAPVGRRQSVYRYDLNRAYESFFRFWPDLGDPCAWTPSRIPSDLGLYRATFGGAPCVLSGQELEELTSHDLGRVEIQNGWTYEGPRTAHGIAWRFCAFCSTYHGPRKRLVRRFPVFVVGKTRAGTWIGSSWYASATAYPTVYASIVSALWQRMYRTARFLEGDLVYGFVDGIHAKSELPDQWIGTEPGLWKLEEHSQVEYTGTFGRWRSATTERHQGVKQ